jgi:hypothetical protein
MIRFRPSPTPPPSIGKYFYIPGELDRVWLNCSSTTHKEGLRHTLA